MANEKRLIDANALWRALEDTGADIHEDWADGYSEWGFSWEAIERLLKEAPTVDAVEVVRCKDCKHYVQFLQDRKECRCTIFSGCYDRPYPTDPDDFCSYGERREGE